MNPGAWDKENRAWHAGHDKTIRRRNLHFQVNRERAQHRSVLCQKGKTSGAPCLNACTSAWSDDGAQLWKKSSDLRSHEMQTVCSQRSKQPK